MPKYLVEYNDNQEVIVAKNYKELLTKIIANFDIEINISELPPERKVK